jgi:ribosome biogenesis GTPase
MAYDDSGTQWNCRIRGKLKIDQDISSTNPIAVGDKVVFSIEDEAEHTAVISGILPRENYIVRTSPHNRHQKHIVAANLDQAVLIATIRNPRTSQGFIDRFLITAEAYHIPAVIVWNKADLHKDKYAGEWEEKNKILNDIGYTTFTVDALHGHGLDELAGHLKDKTSLFSGHSGVGKSTLINHFIPGNNLRVKEVSGWNGKGQHTTTFAEMFELPGGGRIIDTPGVKEFGIVAITKEELSHYFPEMRDRIHGCKFNNCVHINEPGCAIKEAVEEGAISEERYDSYLAIFYSL